MVILGERLGSLRAVCKTGAMENRLWQVPACSIYCAQDGRALRIQATVPRRGNRKDYDEAELLLASELRSRPSAISPLGDRLDCAPVVRRNAHT
jgi:hypothetical protein